MTVASYQYHFLCKGFSRDAVINEFFNWYSFLLRIILIFTLLLWEPYKIYILLWLMIHEPQINLSHVWSSQVLACLWCRDVCLGNVISIYILSNKRIRLDLHPSFTSLCICLVTIDNVDICSILKPTYFLQAVFDCLFLLLANSIFSVSAIIFPQQVLSNIFHSFFLNSNVPKTANLQLQWMLCCKNFPQYCIA